MTIKDYKTVLLFLMTGRVVGDGRCDSGAVVSGGRLPGGVVVCSSSRTL